MKKKLITLITLSAFTLGAFSLLVSAAEPHVRTLATAVNLGVDTVKPTATGTCRVRMQNGSYEEGPWLHSPCSTLFGATPIRLRPAVSPVTLQLRR